MQHVAFVDVEIDMNIETLIAEVIVSAPAKERLVRDQVLDAGEFAHSIEEGVGIDVLVEGPVERADIGNAFNDRFAAN